ncbi:MAG TPA: hypothetical protein EYH44_02680 [Thermoprotei archaeon]|nr:hypothetical protein [Thermoprotei archaeon]
MDNIVGESLGLSAIGIYLHAISIALVIAGSTIALLYEVLSVIKGDDKYHNLAYRIMKISIISFAFGAVSGTVVEFGLIQVWSGFLLILGSYGLFPFYIELLAFMIEAGLIAFLVYGWNRFENRLFHISVISAIAFGSNLSGALIMLVNSWMNVPWGTGDFVKMFYPWAPIYGPDYLNDELMLKIKEILVLDGRPLTQVLSGDVFNRFIDMYGPLIEYPWAAFESIYAWVSVAHQLLATIIAGGSWYAMLLAIRFIRGEDKLLQPLQDLLLFLAVLMVLQGVVGHDMGVQVIKYQPTKFAMMAGLVESGPDPIVGLTTYGDPNHVFYGFDYFINISRGYRPPINTSINYTDMVLNDLYKALEYLPIVNTLYNLKISMAVIAGIIGLIFMYTWVYPSFWIKRRMIMYSLVIIFSTLVTIVPILGWAVRELGRKPWTIYGIFYPEELISLVELNLFTIFIVLGGLILSLSLMILTIYLVVWRESKWI